MITTRRTAIAALRLIVGLGALVVSAAAAAATHWAHANNVYLRYELSGHGPDTVVLLHEVSTSLETWDYIAPQLARDHRILRYDLRGFGLSERTHGKLTMADEMEDLHDLLDTLGIHGKVTLIGGAVGGAIALDFAAVHPDRVNGVVAISPAAYLKAGGLKANGVATVDVEPGVSPLEAAYPLALQQAHPDRIAHFHAIQAAADRQSSEDTIPAAYGVAFADVLPKIHCPALIVATSQWIRPPASFKQLADAIPQGEFAVINTGHFAAIESPELLIPVLQKFLAQQVPQGSR